MTMVCRLRARNLLGCAIFCLLCLSGLPLHAAPPESGNPLATSPLAGLAWLSGHWQGEAFGGVVEEIWSAPVGDSMMGMFRLQRQGVTVFYELMSIHKGDDGLQLNLRHFGADFTAWEKTHSPQTFALQSMDAQGVRFDGFHIQRIGEDAMRITLTQQDKAPIVVNYTRPGVSR